MSNRDKWLKQCGGFGWDVKYGSGFAAKTDLCRACKDSQPDRYAACEAEAKAGRKAAKKSKETIVEENENAEQQDVASEPMPEHDAAVASLEAAGGPVEAEPVKAKKEKKVKAPKAPKPPKADRGPTLMDLIIDTLKKGPKKTKEIVEVMVAAGYAKAAAQCQLSMALSFGRRVGIVVEQDGGWILKA